jgi:hypothetical protein
MGNLIDAYVGIGEQGPRESSVGFRGRPPVRPIAPRGSKSCAGTLADQAALELGHGTEHVEDQQSLRGRSRSRGASQNSALQWTFERRKSRMSLERRFCGGHQDLHACRNCDHVAAFTARSTSRSQAGSTPGAARTTAPQAAETSNLSKQTFWLTCRRKAPHGKKIPGLRSHCRHRGVGRPQNRHLVGQPCHLRKAYPCRQRADPTSHWRPCRVHAATFADSPDEPSWRSEKRLPSRRSGGCVAHASLSVH